MSLPSSPPIYGSWAALAAPIEEGDTGWRAYAVQMALSDVGFAPSGGADGDFGTATLAALKRYQHDRALTADGIAGPATQARLIADADRRVSASLSSLPDGLLHGLAEAEGGGLLAATNPYTPPGGRAGVDCGPVQLRQYGPPFDLHGLRVAFGAVGALRTAAHALLSRAADYRSRRPSLTWRRAVELAVLAHNWPDGAEQFVRFGGLLHPNTLAVWTTKPGGGHYTEQEWAELYVDRVTKYVTW